MMSIASLFCSFAVLFATASSTLTSENEIQRIQSHLSLVEKLLKQNSPENMTSRQKKNRQLALGHLHSYWNAGEFPQNSHHPNRRQPYFIDHQGVPCAVGHLMIETGHKNLASQIAATDNYSFLDQMENPKAVNWAQKMGFTMDELRLIQPSYGYRQTYKDPLLEAAFLLDLPKVRNLLPKKGNKGAQDKLSAALRAAAPEANWKKPKRAMFKLMKPPPRKSDGLELVQFLISKGGDPNFMKQTNTNYNNFKETDLFGTTIYLTKDKITRNLLKEAGGKLTHQEQLLEAIEHQDSVQIKNLLSQKDFSPYGIQNKLPLPLTSAIQKAASGRPYISPPPPPPLADGISKAGPGKALLKTEVSKKQKSSPLKLQKEPGYQVIYALLNHPSKKVTWREPKSDPGPYERTPLSLAVALKNEPILQELLRHGAVIRSSNDYQSILDSYMGSLSPYSPIPAPFEPAYKLLIQYKKLDKPRDNRNKTYARLLRSGNGHGANILKELGAKIDPFNKNLLALHFVGLSRVKKLKPRDVGALKLIVEHGFPIESEFGSSYPLMSAIQLKEYELTKFLLESGANPNFHGQTGCPPLALAVENKDLETIKLLLKHKANINAEISLGQGKCHKPQGFTGKFVKSSIPKMKMTAKIKKLLYSK